ncbi:MAG: RuBisCO large subunit C-terminal-like domain-containing protein [bacterium]
MKNIRVKYFIQTPEDPRKIAQTMATMQSTGTWQKLDRETKKIVSRFGAKVYSVSKTAQRAGALPTKYKNKRKNAAIVEIDYPYNNFGFNIPMLLTTVAGEIFDMQELLSVKLLDIEFPKEYLNKFQGPKFGLEGSRKIAGAYDRPLFGAITKPCVGITPKEIARLAYEVSCAGADFIKDDELLADAPYNRLKDRVKAVSAGLKKAYEETGKTTMYAFNVTDDPDKVLGLHDLVVKGGGRAIMFNVLAGGFGTLTMLSKHTQVPIHCHRDFSVAAIRSGHIGLSSALFTKLTRLCGADQIQCGGIDGYLYETDEEILENFKTCLAPLGKIKKVLPVSSGGEWAGKIPINMRKIKNSDYMFMAGGGVFGHPDGGYAGMRSLIIAYETWKNGKKLETSKDKTLKRAIEKFGKVVY